MADLAKHIGVSHNHLTLLFQKQFGCGAWGYIHRERIERTCDLLIHSPLMVKSVAIECGFPDLQYFNKIIHRTTGYSPTEFRKRRIFTEFSG